MAERNDAPGGLRVRVHGLESQQGRAAGYLERIELDQQVEVWSMRECTVRKNQAGLFDLIIRDDEETETIRNITLRRAAHMIEDLMWAKEARAWET